jgi:hypothetical protein
MNHTPSRASYSFFIPANRSLTAATTGLPVVRRGRGQEGAEVVEEGEAMSGGQKTGVWSVGQGEHGICTMEGLAGGREWA